MAIHIDRVYTRAGDDGETGLALGGRVSKDCQRVETFGAVDELNSILGLAREEVRALPASRGDLRTELEPALARIQKSLFDLGAYLAMAPGTYKEGMPMVGPADIRTLEEEMDRWRSDLTPLSGFILPGGGRLGAVLHVARATGRRAERETVRLHRSEPLLPAAIGYLNRLSDWLFVAARRAAKALGEAEMLWRRSD
jgi:cob(I)alamin adenosyltransferase